MTQTPNQTEQTPREQTPAEEVAERVAEAVPGLKAAAAAVGLQDHQRMLHRNDQRLRDGYQLGRAAFTGQQVDEAMSDGDEMGDIVITGDIHVSDAQQAPQVIDSLRAKDTTPSPPPQPPPQQGPPVDQTPVQPQQPQKESAMKKYGLPLALATLAAAGGAGGATYMLSGDDPPPQKEWGYEGEKYIPAK